MRAGEEPEPLDEGGDPACWAHLFDDDARAGATAGLPVSEEADPSTDDDDVEGDGTVGTEGEALLDVAGARRAGDEYPG